jgi:hypothetical protein
MDWHFHAARIGRRLLYTDSHGFVWVDTYRDELGAARAFEADDRARAKGYDAAPQGRPCCGRPFAMWGAFEVGAEPSEREPASVGAEPIATLLWPPGRANCTQSEPALPL